MVVADAMVYMYCIGLSTTAGVATVVWASWKIYQRSTNKQMKKRKGVSF